MAVYGELYRKIVPGEKVFVKVIIKFQPLTVGTFVLSISDLGGSLCKLFTDLHRGQNLQFQSIKRSTGGKTIELNV